MCSEGCGAANTDPLWQLLDPLAKDDPINWAIETTPKLEEAA